MDGKSAILRSGGATAIGALVLLGLYLTSLQSYLLFHSLVELFTIIVAAGVFVIAWNARAYLDNNYLLFVGIACFFVALLDLFHTLAYKGMGVFPDRSGNLATQLWLASRYLQALSLLVAPFFLGRRLRVGGQIAAFAFATGLVLLSIFAWRIFPATFVEGSGLTAFKIWSEYVISLLVLGATALLFTRRRAFEPAVWRLLTGYLVLTVASELALTSYVSVYDGMNMVGHFLRLLASWALYKAVIETGLVKPYAILLRSLKTSQDQLRVHAVALEARNEDLRESERRLREDADILQSRNAELDAFAHTVAHDLKQPLALIVTASELIRGFADLPRQKLEDLLQRIESTAIEASRIVDGLLLLSQVRKAEAPKEPVDMSTVVANARNRLSETIQEQEAVVIVPERWPAALGYGPWLTEVWTNYLSNAVKYGGRPPRVELGAELRPDGMVRFWVRDNGPGVAPEARNRLFVPFGEFGRIPPPKSGHGLGLSIVLQIVEKLGGEVGVESESGKGSLFYFTLPADRARHGPPGIVPADV